ncbi:hypothetical protein E2I00_009052 [Balaenoptera physalus]|uniref:Calponin-homology (CH) domain-containing protein n=1 Tax=Balaenoptera physalus TaxID=9770 RepID=A0A643CHN0_BALPH|nr:hypothetical protein E2I00_009052 [Balaenoptera physalus]
MPICEETFEAMGLCPDWEAWDPNQPVENAREAMQQADDWLGVPQVIAPEEIVDPNVDEHSVMTYLSQFPKAKLKPGAPVRSKQLNPKKAIAYGPGIEPQGNTVLQPAHFTVQTVDAGVGEVLVYIEDPEGHTEEAKVVPNNDKDRTYAVSYVPKVAGLHKVNVGMALGDANKVSARGPGLEPVGNVANKPTYFDIYTAGAGTGDVAVVIVDPQGRRDTVEVALEDKGDSTDTDSEEPACNPNACRASGRGLQPKGVRVKEVADFKVFTKGAGSGELKVTVKGPSECQGPGPWWESGHREEIQPCEYYPVVPGKYAVTITWGGYAIPRRSGPSKGGRGRWAAWDSEGREGEEYLWWGQLPAWTPAPSLPSPFEVQVSPEAGVQKVRAWGPGLETGQVGKSADFVVEAIGTEVGTLGFSIEGPSQAKIECDDKGDGSCDVRYWPTEPGEYAVHVICDDEDIRDSPFIAHIQPAPPDCFPDKVGVPAPVGLGQGELALLQSPTQPSALAPAQVKAFGPGLEPTGCIVDKPAEFTIDARAAGKGDLKLYAQDAEGCPIDIKVIPNGDGTFRCSYVPTKPIKHTIIISWGGVNVPKSPFRCAPGVVGPAEADIDFDIIKNDNDTFTVKYTPPGAGRYTIMVLFANQEIPASPFHIKVDPSHDASKVKAEGPGLNRTGVEVGKPTHFTVLTKGAGKAKLDVHFAGAAKGEAVRDFEIIDNHDYSYTVKYTAVQQGNMSVTVTYGGDPVPKSPFVVNVAPPLDLSKVKVQGLNSKVAVGQEQAFSVNTRGAGGQGQLDVRMTSPSRRPIPCKLEPGGGAEAQAVRYMPPEEGPYKVDITYDGHPVPGSPFAVEGVLPPDPSKVCAYGPGLKGGLVGTPAPFSIDTKGAGTGGLGLTVEGPCEAKIECQDNGDGSCAVSYLPTEPGEYTINILFAEAHIPGSPFKATIRPVFDPSKVRASGPGLERGKAGEAATFTVDCSEAGEAELTIEILSDAGVKAEVLIHNNADGTYHITYSPAFPGTYTITINPFRVGVTEGCDPTRVRAFGPGLEGGLVNKANRFTVETREGVLLLVPRCQGDPPGQRVGADVPLLAGSPFRVPVKDVVDPGKVKCSGPGLGAGVRARVPQTFRVDCSQAGRAALQVAVLSPTGVAEPVEVRDNGDGTHTVHYTPATDGPYTVAVKYADQELDVDVVENHDGTFDIYYTAPKPGKYVITIRFGGEHVPNSPFHVLACDSMPHVEEPSDLLQLHRPITYPAHWATEEPVVPVEPMESMLRPFNLVIPFTVQKGELTGEVRMPSGKTARPSITDNKDGTITVRYAPTEKGLHQMGIKYDGNHIPGSPLQFYVDAINSRHVSAYGPGLSHGMVNKPATFTIVTKDAGEGGLSLAVEGPSKAEITCKDNKDGTCTVSYLPTAPGDYSIIVGEHVVSVRKSGKHVTNSPFKILVGPSEIGDASKVRVWGKGLSEGHTFQVAEFIVDTRNAGYGGLGLSIEGPSKVDINCEDMEDGTCKVTYCPTEPGTYIINIKFADKHVPGSPFTVKVTGEGRMKESITRRRQAPSIATIGSTCDLNLKIPGNWFQMVSAQERLTRTFTRSSHTYTRTERTEISKTRGGETKREVRVEESTQEMGPHTVTVKYRGQHVPGSPFQFTVGPLGEGGAHKVRAGGTGLERGVAGVPEAGAGGLSIAVEGPSKAEIAFEDRKDGSCGVSYVVQEPGDYEVSIKFNDEHIPDSPFVVPVASLSDDARRLTVTSLQETGLKVNQPASFAVQLNGARGVIDARVHTPSDKHTIRFIPHENGVHSIDVKFNGAHIPGSPFKIRVGEQSQAGDPGLVSAYGPGLEGGTTGVSSEFIVNTLNAGSGALSVTIDGPSKVQLDCRECPEGHAVTYTPMAPGNYLIAIKYGGPQHIVGSPFKAKVTGPRLSGGHSLHETSTVLVETVTKSSSSRGSSYSSIPKFSSDASKVVTRGPGLSQAFVGQKNSFTTPCEEVYVKHMGNRVYNVTYTVKEKGDYILIVKWGDESVPGSPFKVNVP